MKRTIAIYFAALMLCLSVWGQLTFVWVSWSNLPEEVIREWWPHTSGMAIIWPVSLTLSPILAAIWLLQVTFDKEGKE